MVTEHRRWLPGRCSASGAPASPPAAAASTTPAAIQRGAAASALSGSGRAATSECGVSPASCSGSGGACAKISEAEAHRWPPRSSLTRSKPSGPCSATSPGMRPPVGASTRKQGSYRSRSRSMGTSAGAPPPPPSPPPLPPPLPPPTSCTSALPEPSSGSSSWPSTAAPSPSSTRTCAPATSTAGSSGSRRDASCPPPTHTSAERRPNCSRSRCRPWTDSTTCAGSQWPRRA